MKKLLLINGPNLNMLGVREPDVYGRDTLAALEERVAGYVRSRGAEFDCFQSNHEGALIDRLHQAHGTCDGIVYNPGAHTHYSYALRDAVASIDVPVVEVHISDIDSREPFRSISVIAPACVAQVKGLGFAGYEKAVDILLDCDDLVPLGEDFEKDCATGSHIIVAHGVDDGQGDPYPLPKGKNVSSEGSFQVN